MIYFQILFFQEFQKLTHKNFCDLLDTSMNMHFLLPQKFWKSQKCSWIIYHFIHLAFRVSANKNIFNVNAETLEQEETFLAVASFLFFYSSILVLCLHYL